MDRWKEALEICSSYNYTEAKRAPIPQFTPTRFHSNSYNILQEDPTQYLPFYSFILHCVSQRFKPRDTLEGKLCSLASTISKDSR